MRGGAAGAGNAIAGLNAAEQKYFGAGLATFSQTVSVKGTDAGTRPGLGPSFNSNGCSTCHSQPAVGGSSPLPTVTQPQITAASADGATNVLPDFIFQGGPVREARFVHQPDGVTPDGGVHALFTVTGRSDAPGCNIAQPDFTGNEAKNNVVFRIPLPLFGDGLIESIEDSALSAQSAYECSNPIAGVTGICGIPNPSGNTGTFTRFGWKAQNPSIMVFAAEASDVEVGVSNEMFTFERDETPGCVFNSTPEDPTNFGKITGNNGSAAMSGVANMSLFIRMLDQPTPGSCPGGNAASCTNGETQFINIGCALCHNPSYTTSPSSIAPLGNVQANLFSDLLLHHMGPGLADCLTQGAATGDMFRTQVLWGVGQRTFFLHDGRTSDLLQAIEDHFSTSGTAACGQTFGDSEANPVINNFNALSVNDQQDILNFLRSL